MKKVNPDITKLEKLRLADMFNLTQKEIISARSAYLSQWHSCKKKLDRSKEPVMMKLSFEEWLSIWIDSGKWYNRGKKIGQYCMCRKDDIGHYEIGNVYIDLSSINSKTAPVYPRSQESIERIRNLYKGKPRSPEIMKKAFDTKIKNGVFRAVISENDNMKFNSIAEAARYYNLNPSTISERCKKHIKGFRYA